MIKRNKNKLLYDKGLGFLKDLYKNHPILLQRFTNLVSSLRFGTLHQIYTIDTTAVSDTQELLDFVKNSKNNNDVEYCILIEKGNMSVYDDSIYTDEEIKEFSKLLKEKKDPFSKVVYKLTIVDFKKDKYFQKIVYFEENGKMIVHYDSEQNNGTIIEI